MLIHLASAGLSRERWCIPAFEQPAEHAQRHRPTDCGAIRGPSTPRAGCSTVPCSSAS